MRSSASARVTSGGGERRAPLPLTLAAAAGLLFLHVPFAIILLYAFTTDEAAFTFPPPGLTTRWFGVALGVRRGVSWCTAPARPSSPLVSLLVRALLSPRLGEREIRCDAGAALATVIGKSGSGPHGQPLGLRTREGGARAVSPVSQETGLPACPFSIPRRAGERTFQ